MILSVIKSRISCSDQFCGCTLGSNRESEEEEDEEEEEELFSNVNGLFSLFLSN
jgi:hypothetical protein